MGRLSLQTRRNLARGISPRLGRAWGNRKFLGTGTSRGALTHSGIRLLSRVAYTVQPRFAVVVAGANTALTVSVVGNDVTVNSATNGAAAATSTAAQVVAAIQTTPAASALFFASTASAFTIVTSRSVAALPAAP